MLAEIANAEGLKFVRIGWRRIDGIVDGWEQARQSVQSYAAGTWGPASSLVLIDRDERSWIDSA